MTEKAKEELIKKSTFPANNNSYIANRLAYLYLTIIHCMPDTDTKNKKRVLDLLNDIINEEINLHINNPSL